MSSLLTGLSVLGGVALIGGIVYNEWQQRSATMRVAPGEQEKRDPTDGQALADVADDGSAALSVAAPQSVPAIDPLIDQAGRSIVVRARIDNKDDMLRPGLFARVSLTLAVRENAIFVPEQSIIPIGDKTFVYRVVDGKIASETWMFQYHPF